MPLVEGASPVKAERERGQLLGLRRARIRERILHDLVLTSVKTFDYSVSPPGMDFSAAAQRVNEA